MLEIRVEIPALDRLCGILEQANRGRLLEELQAEIVTQLETAARGRTQAREARETEAATQETEAAQKETERPAAPSGHLPTAVGRQEKAEPETEAKPADAPAAPADVPATPAAVTLDAVQRACAGLRDAGKLREVKALFPEFGIKKLSDLEDAQLEAFAGRLRQMGGAL